MPLPLLSATRMNALTALSFVLSLWQSGAASPEPLKLKVGDVVQVVSTVSGYTNEYSILPDGAIYGAGMGRVLLAGKTWERAQADVRSALKRLVKEREVFLSIKSVREDLVFVASGDKGGPVRLTEGLTLRQVLVGSLGSEESDQTEVILFRGSNRPQHFNLASVMRGSDANQDVVLKANDIVSILPNATVRVWVTGLVRNPGMKRIPPGSTVQEAIASAGGVGFSEEGSSDNKTPSLPEDLAVTIRRGPDALPSALNGTGALIKVEAGDVVNVAAPERIHITVGGEVTKPGEYVSRKGATLYDAVVRAGGVTGKGTLRGAYIFRRGELLQYDAAPEAQGARVLLEPQDLVIFNQNDQAYYVLGEVTKPSKFYFVDRDQPLRLTDAIAAASGLTAKGTYRRISIGRAGPDGRLKITQYNLDEFLKDGNVQANPQILPGDTIYVTTAKANDLNSIAQIISSFILLRSVSK